MRQIINNNLRLLNGCQQSGRGCLPLK